MIKFVKKKLFKITAYYFQGQDLIFFLISKFCLFLLLINYFYHLQTSESNFEILN